MLDTTIQPLTVHLEDPARAGVNWYAYAGDNPVNAVDPSGLANDWSLVDPEATWDEAQARQAWYYPWGQQLDELTNKAS